MKASTTFLLASTFAAAAVTAQSYISTPTAGPVYVTVTLDDCPSDTDLPPVVTVTEGVTSTYCPACASATRTTTVYTTTYLSLCTTGTPHSMTPATYTVTETCNSGDNVNTNGHIPPGFTVTTAWCHACATPGPVTVTEPCGCRASGGVALPTGTAGSGASGSGSVSGSGSGSGSASGSASGSNSTSSASTDTNSNSASGSDNSSSASSSSINGTSSSSAGAGADTGAAGAGAAGEDDSSDVEAYTGGSARSSVVAGVGVFVGGVTVGLAFLL